MTQEATTEVGKNIVNNLNGVIASEENVVDIICNTDASIVCVEVENPKIGPPLTSDELWMIKKTMGGKRQDTILRDILKKRGNIIPSDWEEMVIKQGVWLK